MSFRRERKNKYNLGLKYSINNINIKPVTIVLPQILANLGQPARQDKLPREVRRRLIWLD